MKNPTKTIKATKATKEPPHPMQPIIVDKWGTHRFKCNSIVRYLLEEGRKFGVDLNKLACLDFSKEDREQFSQLIGYSVSGFAELSQHRKETVEIAYRISEAIAEGKTQTEEQARLEYLESELQFYKKELPLLLKEPMARIFNKHPADLIEE